MHPIQAEINIERGIITAVAPTPGSVTVITEESRYHYAGAWLMPGFVDSHCHLAGLGSLLNSLSLEDAESADECVERAKQHPSADCDWLTGFGWNQEKWVNKEYPKKEILDAAFPNTPVYLTRIDGHAAWVNSEALKLAGIDANISDPAGGAILRDNTGEPTGILIDEAMDMVNKYIPKPSKQQIKSEIKEACNECLRVGLTEVHDMDVNPEYIEIFKDLEKNNELPIRVHSFVKAQNDEWKTHNIKKYSSKILNLRGLKFYADGALGSHGAAMLQPYKDKPDSTGLMLNNEDRLFKMASEGLKYGWEIAIHAIGDAANRMTLNAYEKLYHEKIADSTCTLRVEHAQIVHPSDLEIFAKYGIIAAVQPFHCISDAAMAENRLEEKVLAYSYPWKSFMDMNVLMTGGSDFPIEPHDPLTGIDAFVRRIPTGKTEPWHPEERISRNKALEAYIINPRITEKSEKFPGKIEEGCNADLVVADNNLINCKDVEILNTNILAVFTAGKLRYEKF